LILVLWGLVLIGLLVSHLMAASRMETHIAMNMVTQAEASAAADGAVHHAIFHFLDPDDRTHWAADGEPHRIAIGPVTVDVRIIDEAGRVNPNIASEGLMASLFRVVGADAGQAAALASAMADWIRPSDLNLFGGTMDAYRTAGFDYGPPGAPFETLDEINLVLGMTPEMAARLRPHLSLWTKNNPNPDQADPVVRRALEGQPRLSDGVLPRIQRQSFLTVEAIASGRLGARFARHAVIGVSPSFERGFKILAWDAPAAE
jgi:general secretion pathway protein K